MLLQPVCSRCPHRLAIAAAVEPCRICEAICELVLISSEGCSSVPVDCVSEMQMVCFVALLARGGARLHHHQHPVARVPGREVRVSHMDQIYKLILTIHYGTGRAEVQGHPHARCAMRDSRDDSTGRASAV